MAAYPLLDVQGLRAGYGATPILQGVEFSVGKGEIVAIIGRNGVGKTTLMKCLIGLLPATAGTILYDRSDVTAEAANVRAARHRLHPARPWHLSTPHRCGEPDDGQAGRRGQER